MATETSEKETATPTAEEQEELDHEKAVNEDPNAESLPPLLGGKGDDDKEGTVQDRLKADGIIDEDEGGDDDDKDKEDKDDTETKDEFDAEILSIALDLGLSEEKARSFSSVADLERALVAISGPEDEKPSKGEPKDNGQADETNTVDPSRVHIEPSDDIDEALAKQLNDAMNKIGDRHDAQSKALEETIVGLQATIQHNQATQFVSQFDALLAKHGEKYQGDVGEGSTMDLEGKFRTNRDKVVDEMSVIVASHQLRNRPIPSDEALMKKALKEVFGEGKEEDNGEAVTRRKSQFLRRSSSRSSKGASSQKQARIDLREKLAALSGVDE